MSDEATKVCSHSDCPRAGEALPLSEFYINRRSKDGHMPYCKPCHKARTNDYYLRSAQKYRIRNSSTRLRRLTPVEAATISHKQRVLRVLGFGERLEFNALAYHSRLSREELSAVLPEIHGRNNKVMSKNGTGARRYFLTPEPKPIVRFDPRSPSGSFSTLNYCFPVMKGSSGGRR